MVLDTAAGHDELRHGATAEANAYHGYTGHALNAKQLDLLSRADQLQVIVDVVDELRHGLPVRMNYSSLLLPPKVAKDTLMVDIGLTDEPAMSWFLPPEIDACDLSAYVRAGGHAVNIVGASIVGPIANPHMYKSYFVIVNNFGLGQGFKGHFAMKFAAFRVLARSLFVLHLTESCGSWACRP